MHPSFYFSPFSFSPVFLELSLIKSDKEAARRSCFQQTNVCLPKRINFIETVCGTNCSGEKRIPSTLLIFISSIRIVFFLYF
jgi:hypothetical protein